LLGVNIDHVATLRQARYALHPASPNAEPSVLEAASEAEAGGADGITVHLRADRRHIQDADVRALAGRPGTRLNLEMGDTPEIVATGLELRPASVCLVPENRAEVTTEGGLDVVAHEGALAALAAQFRAAGVRVSLFIDPEPAQVEAAARTGAEMVELHTGRFANAAPGAARDAEVASLAAAARLAHRLGLQVNAGHGITTPNLPALFAVPHLVELNVGHHLVSRAVVVGLRAAVAEMRRVMDGYGGGAGPGGP
jgi:pyridoxine 5-phosphate synthase